MTTPVYGVFLRPDPLTASAISTITFQVERQFGFVSAGAFPPHATLAGSVPIHADPTEIVEALDPVLSGRESFTVHNGGIVRFARAVTFDVDRLPDGSRNRFLAGLAVDVNAALAPLSHEIDGYLVSPFSAEGFRAHLSLASHEMNTRADLADEVEEFIRALPLDGVPSSFSARHVTLYRFESDDWAGHWWRSLTWSPVRTWRLGE